MKQLIPKTLIYITLFTLLGCIFQSNDMYYVMKGARYEKQGKYQKAIEEYEKAINLNPYFTEVYISIGNIFHRKLKDNLKAIETYMKGLEYVPNDYSLNLNIMYVYFDMDDLDKGIKHYKILSKIRNDDDRHTFPRRIVEKITKDQNQEEQISFYTSYLGINPSDIILHEYLSRIYMERKDYQKAKIEFKSLLKFGSSTGREYFGLAVCEFYLENYHESMNHLIKAQELGESVPEKYFEFVREKLGKKQ